MPTGHLGYPSLFTNFGDEIIQPLADYGGGSPTGSLYLQEPGFPAASAIRSTPATGAAAASSAIRSTPTGAGFKAGQEPFVELPRPTDMDVDGRSRIYVASWREASSPIDGPNVGYVIRVTDPAAGTPAFPDLKPPPMSELLEAPRSAWPGPPPARPARDPAPGRTAGLRPGPRRLAHGKVRWQSRVAAIFTLRATARQPTHETLLIDLRKDDDRPRIRPARPGRPQGRGGAIPPQPFLDALTDADPRVRSRPSSASARLGKTRGGRRALSRTGRPRPAGRPSSLSSALVALRGHRRVPGGDRPVNPTPRPRRGRVLQSMHEARVGGWPAWRSSQRRMTTTLRRQAFSSASAGSTYREADWDGKWWSTRPDTSGPYLQARRHGTRASGSARSSATRWTVADADDGAAGSCSS